jgi:hypothetical protein
VYGRTSGAYNLIGVVGPYNSALSGDPSYNTFDDFGSATTNQLTSVPWWAPLTDAAAAANDLLATTIVNCGASTAGTACTSTAVTLATAVTNNVTGVTARFDIVPNIQAAQIAANGGRIIFPVPSQSNTNNAWVTSSYLATSSNVTQCGAVFLGDTLEQDAGNWDGCDTNTTLGTIAPQFIINNHIGLFGPGANPVIWQPNAGVSVNEIALQTSGNGYQGITVTSSGALPVASYTDDTFGTTCSGACSDVTGVLFSAAGPPVTGSAGLAFQRVAFLPGPTQTTGLTTVPGVSIKNFGEISFDGIMLKIRGIFLEPYPGGLGVQFNQRFESKGPITPVLSVYNAGGGTVGGWINSANTIMDNSSVPLVTNWGPTSSSIGITLAIAGTNPGNAELLSGFPFTAVTLNGFTNTSLQQAGQNVNIVNAGHGLLVDGVLATTTPTPQMVTDQNAHLSVGPQYSVFTNSTPTAPTCSVASAGPPYTPAGTYVFTYSGVYWPNSGFGGPSQPSTSCTANGTSQQITITIPAALPGVKGYQIWGNNAQLSSTIPATTGLTYLFTSAVAGGVQNTDAGGGPAGIQGQNNWEYSGQSTGWHDFLQQGITPNDPPAGWCRYFMNNSGALQGINSVGASCAGGGGVTWNAIGGATGPASINMYVGGTNYATQFNYNGTSNSAMGLYNIVAATSGTSQASPVFYLYGNEWHAAASVVGGAYFLFQPGNGTDANSVFNIGHQGTATGIMTTQAVGPVASGASGAGYGGATNGPEGTQPPSSSPYNFAASGYDGCYADSTLHGLKCSFNADGPYPMTRTIASGTATLPTSSITNGTCTAATITGTVTNILSTDSASVTWNADPTSITGYAPVSGGASLYVQIYVGTASLGVKVCNNSSSPVTPSAATVNWRVTR